MTVPASEALMALAQTILKNPARPPAEIAYLAVILAHAAWNKSNGLGEPPASFFEDLAGIERSNPKLWHSFTVQSATSALESLVLAKNNLFPLDHREIVSSSVGPTGAVHAAWREVCSA